MKSKNTKQNVAKKTPGEKVHHAPNEDKDEKLKNHRASGLEDAPALKNKKQ